MKLGVAKEYFGEGLDPTKSAQAVEAAIEKLEGIGLRGCAGIAAAHASMRFRRIT